MKKRDHMETLHPLVEGALGLVRDIAWNAIAEHFEDVFTINGEDPYVQRKLDDAFAYALKQGGQYILSEDDDIGVLELLVAFSRQVKSSAYEYAAVALSPPGRVEPITSLFATKGSPTRVSVPSLAIKQIGARLAKQETSKAIFIHNHPEGILHDILGIEVLGPSSQDREVVTRSYQRWFGTSGFVRSEFYLVENNEFRKFVLPSAKEIWDLAREVGIVKP